MTLVVDTASKWSAKPRANASDRGRRAIRKLNIVGLTMVVAFVGCVGGWAATSELAGAVIAPGAVIVESSVKKVQHPTGGVVKEILVKEGSVVEEGQVLVRLDDTVTRATLGVVRSQLDENDARQARLLAEREGADAIAHSSGARRAQGRIDGRRRGQR